MRDQEEELLQVINRARASLAGKEKLVIYSGQVEDYKLLAETISYEVYFLDAEDKKGTFHRFANEKRYDTIVATSAFGTGINIPYIR